MSMAVMSVAVFRKNEREPYAILATAIRRAIFMLEHRKKTPRFTCGTALQDYLRAELARAESEIKRGVVKRKIRIEYDEIERQADAALAGETSIPHHSFND